MAERIFTYSYAARDVAGARRTGEINAASENDAVRALRKEGLTVTAIRLGRAPVDAEEVLTREAARRVRRDDVIDFSAQLCVMLETGVPLAEALGAYVEQSRSSHLRRIIELVSDRITSGVSFSAAIVQFPRVFPKLMVSLIQASEATGTLGAMLGRVAEYMGKERKTVKQIRGALTYPAMMVTMAIAVTSFLIAWVLPKFAAIYESRSATLPAPTRFVLGFSHLISNHWILIVSGLAVAIVALTLFWRSPRGRRFFDMLKIRTPVIGPIYTNFYLSRAASTLAELLSAGVSLTDALRIVPGTTNNALWRAMWSDIDDAIRTGKPMHDVIQRSNLTPASVTQMIAAGERTGRLPKVLKRLADVAEQRMEESIKTGTQLIEPVMIIFMGALIGGIAMALLLPIFTISSVMTQ